MLFELIISYCHLQVPDDLDDAGALTDQFDRTPSPPLQSEIVTSLISPSVTHINLHRVNVIDDMIREFKCPNILLAPVNITFASERGVDDNGVTRDALTLFWEQFLSSYAEGEVERIPMINSKFGKSEWNAIGRIILKGLTDVQIFPVALSMAFCIALVHGEEAVGDEDLLDSFCRYICESERDVVNAALSGSLDDDQKEDLIDLLNRMGCRTIPTQASTRSTILQLAHKELIQQPKYALQNMSEVARETLQIHLPDPQAVKDLLKSKIPTNRLVLNMLRCTPLSQVESQVFEYLRRFVRGLDDRSLKRFLRFVTGADVLCVPTITVDFCDIRGLQRRPVAHTCGAVLELPKSYSSYPEFRNEFQNVLDGDCFVIDIA